MEQRDPSDELRRLRGNWRPRRRSAKVIPTSLLLAIVVPLIVSAVLYLLMRSGSAEGTRAEIWHVSCSGKIRCGYVSNPPSCMVIRIRQLSGIFVEAVETMAKVGMNP